MGNRFHHECSHFICTCQSERHQLQSHGLQPMDDNCAHSLGPPQEFSAYLEYTLFFWWLLFLRRQRNHPELLIRWGRTSRTINIIDAPPSACPVQVLSGDLPTPQPQQLRIALSHRECTILWGSCFSLSLAPTRSRGLEFHMQFTIVGGTYKIKEDQRKWERTVKLKLVNRGREREL